MSKTDRELCMRTFVDIKKYRSYRRASDIEYWILKLHLGIPAAEIVFQCDNSSQSKDCSGIIVGNRLPSITKNDEKIKSNL